MLSILIPVYNYNIVALAKSLHKQASEQLVDFELLVMEDASTQFLKENKEIEKLENCKYIVLAKNIGRSAIRNKLADEAKYEHLLFMDGDAEVCSPHFIEKYLSFCNEECIVIGGTSYDPKESNKNYSLRLKYGRKREARSAQERNKSNFATFNFLISKTIFNKVRFDESIRGYGHEDMLLGHQLNQLGYNFIQIENPLIHKGLDDNQTFICKTEEGAKNLFLLYKTGKYPFLATDSKLLSTYTKIEKIKLTPLFSITYDILNSTIKRCLSCKNPSLRLYDFYKLIFICKTARQSDKLSASS